MIEVNVPPGELHRIDASVIHFDPEGHVLEILTDDEETVVAIFKDWTWVKLIDPPQPEPEEEDSEDPEEDLDEFDEEDEDEEDEESETALSGPIYSHDGHVAFGGSFEDPARPGWSGPTSQD